MLTAAQVVPTAPRVDVRTPGEGAMATVIAEQGLKPGSDSLPKDNTIEPRSSDQRVADLAKAIPAGKVGAVEICCGHAGYTASLLAVGFDAIGVDWKFHKNMTPWSQFTVST